MNRKLMTWAALAASCWLAPSAHADRPATQAEREAMGFDDPAQQVMVRENEEIQSLTPREPTGAGNLRWQTRMGAAFQGRTGNFDFYTTPMSLVCDAGTERFATATFDLPDGAEIRFVDTFVYDNSSSDDMLVFFYSACASLLDGDDPPIVTQLGNAQSSGAPGSTVVTMNFFSSPIVVKNYDCKYMVRVNFASPSGTCVGNDIALDKARVEYQRFQDQ